MMALVSEQLAQLTARSGVVRAGTGRSGATGKSYELKANGTGELIWDRPTNRDGDPDDTASSWTTGRE